MEFQVQYGTVLYYLPHFHDLAGKLQGARASLIIYPHSRLTGLGLRKRFGMRAGSGQIPGSGRLREERPPQGEVETVLPWKTPVRYLFAALEAVGSGIYPGCEFNIQVTYYQRVGTTSPRYRFRQLPCAWQHPFPRIASSPIIDTRVIRSNPDSKSRRHFQALKGYRWRK
jgi:hypothetical protein